MPARSAQCRDSAAACRSSCRSASRHTGLPKPRSPSSSSSTTCATSCSPPTAPNSRTRHENSGKPPPIGWLSRTTNCRSDRRRQIKTAPMGHRRPKRISKKLRIQTSANTRFPFLERTIIEVGRIIQMIGDAVAIDLDEQETLRDYPTITGLGQACVLNGMFEEEQDPRPRSQVSLVDQRRAPSQQIAVAFQSQI